MVFVYFKAGFLCVALASASEVLGLRTCATTARSNSYFKNHFLFRFYSFLNW